MRPGERVRLSRFIEKLSNHDSYAKQLGLSFELVRNNDSEDYTHYEDENVGNRRRESCS